VADQEGIQARLNNIRSVEPILGAMRTIALGSWQAALNRQARVRRYSQRLGELLLPVVDLLGSHRRRGHKPGRRSEPESGRIQAVVIGSERGLCGAFNSSLIQTVEAVLARYAADGFDVQIAVLGSRVRRGLDRGGHVLEWTRPLPMTTLPSSELAHELVHTWLRRYQDRELDGVYVIYNSYKSSTVYEPISVRLVPPPLPAWSDGALPGEAIPWPAPYIDTDPVALYTRLIRLWTTTEMYRLLLDSAAAEHSARYQLMEGATQNANRLIDELTLALQAARQQAITSEMQELAVGAGLLGT
jgi:F-type H+-transporting ATPase subunit gamma